uniref:GNAT family N-acetyltransferase n=1 Tax=Serratia quinivorans TaxID=137545 RepID=UPI0035C6CCAD
MHLITLPFTTERLHLRRFTPADLDAYAAYHYLPEVYRYLYAPTPDEAQLTSLFSQAITSRFTEDGDILYCAVTLKDSGELIGEVLLKLANGAALQGEIGYIFNPAYAGKGYAAEAVKSVLDRGFAESGFHRIFARLDAANQGSIGVVERLGMRKEAHLRQNDRFNGEWGDELIYALLQEEWCQTREQERL